MRIVLGFVIVSLIGGFVAWLVTGRGSAPRTAVGPAPRGDAARPDPTPGFLESRFGDDEPEPEPEPEPTVPPPGRIKGKTSSMIFHAPDSPSYERTVADVWFETEEDAIAAGYRPPKRRGSAD